VLICQRERGPACTAQASQD